MSDKMKPCPFCGNDDFWLQDADGPVFVVCLVCQAHGPTNVNYDAAVDDWNTRADEEEGE